MKHLANIEKQYFLDEHPANFVTPDKVMAKHNASSGAGGGGTIGVEGEDANGGGGGGVNGGGSTASQVSATQELELYGNGLLLLRFQEDVPVLKQWLQDRYDEYAPMRELRKQKEGKEREYRIKNHLIYRSGVFKMASNFLTAAEKFYKIDTSNNTDTEDSYNHKTQATTYSIRLLLSRFLELKEDEEKGVGTGDINLNFVNDQDEESQDDENDLVNVRMGNGGSIGTGRESYKFDLDGGPSLADSMTLYSAGDADGSCVTEVWEAQKLMRKKMDHPDIFDEAWLLDSAIAHRDNETLARFDTLPSDDVFEDRQAVLDWDTRRVGLYGVVLEGTRPDLAPRAGQLIYAMYQLHCYSCTLPTNLCPFPGCGRIRSECTAVIEQTLQSISVRTAIKEAQKSQDLADQKAQEEFDKLTAVDYLASKSKSATSMTAATDTYTDTDTNTADAIAAGKASASAANNLTGREGQSSLFTSIPIHPASADAPGTDTGKNAGDSDVLPHAPSTASDHAAAMEQVVADAAIKAAAISVAIDEFNVHLESLKSTGKHPLERAVRRYMLEGREMINNVLPINSIKKNAYAKLHEGVSPEQEILNEQAMDRAEIAKLEEAQYLYINWEALLSESTYVRYVSRRILPPALYGALNADDVLEARGGINGTNDESELDDDTRRAAIAQIPLRGDISEVKEEDIDGAMGVTTSQSAVTVTSENIASGAVARPNTQGGGKGGEQAVDANQQSVTTVGSGKSKDEESLIGELIEIPKQKIIELLGGCGRDAKGGGVPLWAIDPYPAQQKNSNIVQVCWCLFVNVYMCMLDVCVFFLSAPTSVE